MKVLVATKERLVFDVFTPDVEPIAVLDTRRIYEAVPEAQLAIVDYDDIIPHPFSVGFVRGLLEAAPIRCCSSQEFLTAPEGYLAGAPRPRRLYRPLPKCTIAFTSYSGGTGKTSFSLDTALHLVAKSRAFLQLPAAVIELTYGSSALRSLIGDFGPSLSELVDEPDLPPHRFQGVALYPMDHDRVRRLPLEQVQDYIHQQMSHYVLTVIDTIWPHGVASAIGEEVDLWVVLATPRLDAIDNARKLRAELSKTYGSDKVIVAVNQIEGLSSRLALWGTPREIQVPQLQRSNVFFDGRLGREVLGYIYGPLWNTYQKAKRRRGLGRRRRSPDRAEATV
jgi:hypothetical protein